MNNTGDGIYIEGGFDNEQINGAIEETLKRVQGLSDGTASAGASMDSTFNDIQQKVTTTLNTIDKNIEFNKNEIKNLQAQYKTLGAEMKAALASGNTSLAKDKQAAIQAIDKEIAALANENKELERSKQKVAETAQAWADNQKKQNENAQAQVTLRQRIKEVKEEMQNLVNQAQIEGRQVDENTGRYAELRAELGRLTDIQSDVAQQAKILANDEAQIAGVINGLSGLSGGLSAATGAVSLFAGENENLQKVMTKLQSVMAITMGLQQLQQTLNKDSAFRLTTLASIKQWWGKVEAEANAKAAASTTIDTAAKEANTAAQTQNAGAKTANKVATDTNTTSEIVNAGATELAGKAAVKSAGFFRVLSTAIKSVPGIGWLIAGATALIAVAGKLIGKEKERRQAALDSAKAIKEAQEEERKEINKTASDNIAKIEELSRRYKQLGNNFNEQKKFIDANKEAFRSLGVEITTVNDATQLLIDKKDEYVRAQLEYAKADVYRQRAKKLFEENADLLDTYDAIAARQYDKVPVYGPNGATMVEWDTRSEGDKIIQQQLEDGAKRIRQEIDELFDKAFRAETIADGLTSGFKKATTTVSNQVATSAEETLKKQLSAIKERYQQFYAWVNSTDKGARDAARTEFADLVEQGSTYLEFLKRKRDELTAAIAGGTATNEQAEQMRVLNDQIAQETKETVLSQFEAQLQSEMQGAQSLIEMLDIIKRKKDEVTSESGKTEILSEEDQARIEELGRQMEESYNGNVDLLHRKIIEAQRLVEKGWADAGNGIATLYSSLYDEDIFQNGVETQIMITPILPDGSVLSPEELDDYVYNELSGAENILDADRLGLVIHVGDSEDNGFHLHEMQEEYYDIIDFWNKANTQINAEKAKVVGETEKQLNKKIAQRTSALLEEYRSFNDRLVALGDAYINDVAILERAYAEAKTDEEKKRIEDALAARRKAYDNARQGILDSEAKTLAESSDAYQALFVRATAASKEMLKKCLADAQTLLKAVKGEAVALPAGITQELVESIRQSPEQIKELNDLIESLKDSINNAGNIPFVGVVSGFKKLQEAREEYANASKSTAKEIAEADTKLAKAEKEAIKQICSGLNDVCELLGDVGSELKTLGESTDNEKLKAVGDLLNAISSIGSAVLNGYSNGGWGGAAVAGLQSLANVIVSSYSTMYEAIYQMQQAQSNYNEQVLLLSMTLKDIYDNGFGVRHFDEIIEASRLAENALNKYREAIAKINGDSEVITGVETGFFQVIWAGISQLWDDDALDQLDIKESLHNLAPNVFNSDGSVNIDNLRIAYNEGLFDKDKDFEKQIKEILDMYDKWLENQKVVAEYIKETFSYLGDEAINSLTDAIINGGDAWETWRKKGSKAIESLGEQLMYELFLSKKFDDFSKMLDNIINDPNLSKEEKGVAMTDAMNLFFDQMHDTMDAAQEWGERWKEMAAERGFDIWSNEDSNSANSFYGAARTVTETTASLIHGQMNAMRVNQVSQGDILRQQLLMLSSIKSDTAYLRSIDNRLRNIESRTSGTQYAARINH